MQQFWLRVLLAALFSMAGAMATHFWARALRTKDSPHAESEVAFVSSSTNEVMKRPAQRQIWRTTYPNEPLYFDEAIRTAGNAEAKIRFHDGTVIELNADSVIEIKRDESGINLGFLKGSLFIRAGEQPSLMTIQSGEEKFAIHKSEVTVTKAAPTGPMEVEVLKGEMKVLKTDVKTKQIRRLKITRPTQDEIYYLRPDSEDRANIEWEPIDASYTVQIETGESPQELVPVAAVKPQRGSAGKIQAPLKVGKNYFRLIAKSPNLPELISTIKQARVLAKIPPVPLSPPMESVELPKAPAYQVSFTWANPGLLRDLRLEVSRDPALKEPLYSDTVGEKTSVGVAVGEKYGKIYWRMSGRLPNANQMISSPIHSFFAHEKPLDPLLTPVLRAPAKEQKIAYTDMKAHGVNLTWGPVRGADRYEVMLTEVTATPDPAKTFKREMVSNNIKIENLQPAAYTWYVVARDGKGQTSPPSETRKFQIEGVPPLPWADGLTNVKFTYRTPKPFLKAVWTRGPGAPVSWRVRVYADRQPAAEAEWKTVQKPELETQVPADGNYRVEAESLDANGNVIARTPVRNTEVAMIPLPLAPEFTPETPAVIEARSDGTVDLEWLPVKDAREYVMEVKDSEGKVVESKKQVGRKVALRFKTGEYEVLLQAIDVYGRAGPQSPPRPLKVPEYSEIRAPKIKAATVK